MRALHILLFTLPLLLVHSQPLDELTEQASLHVGDSLVFRQKQQYLFHNRRAFELCDFARATLIYTGKSAYFTWSPSRPGCYYFSTSKEECEKGEKFPVRVIVSTPADVSPPASSPSVRAPPPTAGGDFSASPSRGWGGWVSSSPSSHSPLPGSTSPLIPKEGAPPAAMAPAGSPESGGGGIPFLSSNPAVPLPTGMTNTAGARPLPTPGDGAQVVGLGSLVAKVEFGWLASVMIFSVLGLWA